MFVNHTAFPFLLKLSAADNSVVQACWHARFVSSQVLPGDFAVTNTADSYVHSLTLGDEHVSGVWLAVLLADIAESPRGISSI